MAATYIETLAQKSGPLQAEFARAEECYKKKLWHQLSDCLDGILKHDSLSDRSKSADVLALYDQFIKSFQTRISPLRLARFAERISVAHVDSKAACDFLHGFEELVGKDTQASVFLQAAIAELELFLVSPAACLARLEQAQARLDKLANADACVHARYYQAALCYHKKQAALKAFYEDALSYLAYACVSELPEQRQQALCYDMALAALCSTSVHSFGELLEHQIARALDGDAQRAWIIELVRAMHAGDLAKYDELVRVQDVLSREPLLRGDERKSALREKISVLALMALAFSRSKDERVISFDDIATATRLSLAQVELLVMKAFSVGLVRGSIDEVAQTVTVTWVQPTVLDHGQVSTLKKKLDDWVGQVSNTLLFVEGTLQRSDFQAAV